jgi:hypothetical protein
MNRKKYSRKMSIFLALMLATLFWNACHLDRNFQSSQRSTSSVDASEGNAGESAANDSGEPGRCEVPKTGQRFSYAAGDDGDLQTGRALPGSRFIDNGDSTVSDQLTGLMWTKNADKANGKAEWEEALSNSAACNDGGYTDWRLPNRKELESLVDLGRFDPALPAAHPFENVKPSYYWSSTTTANDEEHAWILHFYTGLVARDDKISGHHVWYVRSGQ